MPTVRKRSGGRFQAIVRIKPHPDYSRMFDSESDAKAWAAELSEQLLAVRKEPKIHASRSLTLGDALAKYAEEVSSEKKSAYHERKLIRVWRAHPLAARPLSEIRGVDLARHKQARLKAGRGGNTIRLELAIISHLYTVARTDWGLDYLVNPVKTMRMPKLPKGRDRRLRGGELERLLQHCKENGDKALAAAVELAVETAMRRSELAGLLWSVVDLKDRTAYLADTKNSTSRTVPLSRRAMAVLESLERKKERVLGLKPDTISHRFSAACNACGIEGLRFHDLRHEAVSRLFEKGFGMVEVATISGHQTMQMLKRYTHLDPRKLLDRLG
ncbi:phage integrase site specific recombinase [Cupriavidus basilensis OR16]|uniref:Phage integrase site specific recombinase n=1 Tax=Cupriavidus basilensis OR16 TaxID=1127483 RepID=H1SD57_9BURK|nr:site-specific integrase [Cupriavidus basilensis]EHP39555.1 phage integrase site specific recombinase [Cupriavidus basilensis OR16]